MASGSKNESKETGTFVRTWLGGGKGHRCDMNGLLERLNADLTYAREKRRAEVKAAMKKYAVWLNEARKRGCKRILLVLIERLRVTKVQLRELSGVKHTDSKFRAHMKWLKLNALVEVKGKRVSLLQQHHH